MVESEATGFAWALGADENTEKIALSLASFVKIVSGDPPIAEIQIPDTTPSLLTAASQSSTIAWKNVDDAVRVWNLATGEELLSITGIQAAVTGLSLSAAGDILAVSTYDGSLQVWDLLSGQLHHEWKMPVWLSNLDFSPDTRLLAGVDTPNFTVRMIDLATGSEVRSLSWTEHASPVLYGAHFSPDWRQLAWVARGSIQLMDVNSGDLGPMLNHEDFVNAIAWSPDGSLIASAAAGTVNGDYAPLVLLWDAANGQKVETLVLKNPVNGIEFSPDGRELAILDSNGTLHIWIVQP
jgi:WD40 repeat protein